jgi:hypothetical protein
MLVAFVTGGIVGYSPVIACHLFASGFTAAFIDSIRMLFEAGTTNLPLPLPRIQALLQPSAGQDGASALRESLLALAGLAGGGVLILAMHRVWKDWRPSNVGTTASDTASDAASDAAARSAGGAVFAAAVLVSIPYAHYTVSRFDVFHVALSILPILVAAWTWPGRKRTGLGDLVLVAAVVAGTVLSLFEQRAYPMLRGWTAERVQVLGDTLYVEPHAADVLSLLRAQVDAHARDGQSFLAAPYWPGAYAVERRRGRPTRGPAVAAGEPDEIGDPLAGRRPPLEQVGGGAVADPGEYPGIAERPLAEDRDASHRRSQLAGDQAEQSGLARAVGTQQAVGPGAELDRQIVDPDHGAVELGGVLEDDHGRGFSSGAGGGVDPHEADEQRAPGDHGQRDQRRQHDGDDADADAQERERVQVTVPLLLVAAALQQQR